MCGRIGQFSAWQSYVEALELFREVVASLQPNPPRYNVAPGTKTLVLYPDGTVRNLWWGFRPRWAVTRKIPPMINARADKLESATWKSMLQSGRVIVPADCWYEWIKADDGKKQPFLLRAKDRTPLFIAALSSVAPDVASGPRDTETGTDSGTDSGVIDGMVMITDASDAGMVDVHDRRPVVLKSTDALRWLDASLTADPAAEIVRTASRPVADFEWYKVGRQVNDTRNDHPDLLDPVK